MVYNIMSDTICIILHVLLYDLKTLLSVHTHYGYLPYLKSNWVSLKEVILKDNGVLWSIHRMNPTYCRVELYSEMYVHVIPKHVIPKLEGL